MTPSSLPLPTDNIYKFACLFGLALIVSAILLFVSVYTSSLDRKVKYLEVVISLESKQQRSKSEEDLLALNRRLIDISKSNETLAVVVIAVVTAIGVLLSIFGAKHWSQEIQSRDDRLAELQLEKLELELGELRGEHKAKSSVGGDGA